MTEEKALVVQSQSMERFDPEFARRQIAARVEMVKEITKTLMQKNVHYGVIPGAGTKATLFKPGAETLMLALGIASVPEIEDLSGTDGTGMPFVRYRIMCRGFDSQGNVVGAGIGEASSLEEKWAWKKAWDEEFNATPEAHRRQKFGWDKVKRQKYSIKQIRQSPYDIANTILKQAKKRAFVDLALTVAAASDTFTQDLEEMREYLEREVVVDAEVIEEPQEKKPEPKKAAPAKPQPEKSEAARRFENSPLLSPPEADDEPGPDPDEPAPQKAAPRSSGDFDKRKVYNAENVPAEYPRISSAQLPRLFAIGRSGGHTSQQVKSFVDEMLGFEVDQIPMGETYNEICSKLEKGTA
jgi:hypothetical protein